MTMPAYTNFGQAQRASHTQRPSDQRYGSRSVTGQIPAKMEAKALADFRRFYAREKDAETRAYLAGEIRRLGGQP